MNIGMILDKTFPPDPRVENEAIALIKAGHRVFLFCLTYTREKKQDIVNGIEVRRYTSNKLEYKLSALAYTVPLYSYMLKSKIRHFIRQNIIQAIHIHDMQIADAVFKVNRKFNLPTILDLHENRPEIMKLYPHINRFPGNVLISIRKWKKKEVEFIETANHVIVVTQEAKEDVVERSKKEARKISVLPNTVRNDFFEKQNINSHILSKFQNKFVLLYIGDTGIRRGLLTAIDSVKLLAETIHNLQLVIVGKSSDDILLKKRVVDLGIEDFVVFEGWQQPNTFESYIKASAICISPLYQNKHHDTTYANKLFQYMSLGKPVLVSNVIAQKNLIEKVNSGFVHKEQDVKDFTEKIIVLYNDEDLRKKLGTNGQNFVRNEFTWEKTSKDLIKIYNDLSV